MHAAVYAPCAFGCPARRPLLLLVFVVCCSLLVLHVYFCLWQLTCSSIAVRDEVFIAIFILSIVVLVPKILVFLFLQPFFL